MPVDLLHLTQRVAFWEAKVFVRAGQAEAWLEGLTVSPMDAGRPTF